MLTIYCDLDGVLSNFDKEFFKLLNGRKQNREIFRELTEEHRLFSKLEPMGNAHVLINRLNSLSHITGDINVEILSSINRVTESQRRVAIEDKMGWLRGMGIKWKTNFVNCKEEKKRYATPNSLLIDDNMLNVTDFKTNYGYGIFHIDSFVDETIKQLDEIVDSFLYGEFNGNHRFSD